MQAKYILTTRNDGLGERLKAMLNGLVLAEYFGVEFRFHWRMNKALDAGHCVRPYGETFDPEFVAAYHVGQFDKGAYSMLTPDYRDKDQVRALLAESTAGLIVNQEPMERICGGIDDLPGRYRRAWAKIQWLAPLQAAMDDARAVWLPDNIVAIHLRAGDMIYGQFRLFDSYTHKALCFPVAKRIVDDCYRAGKQVMIFGQDLATCMLLAERAGGTVTKKHSWADDLTMALIEIVLMSRCTEIYAGVSGFSKVAELVGGAKLITPTDIYTPAEIVNTIMSDRDIFKGDLHPLQKAFAFFNVVYYGYDGLMGKIGSQAIIQALEMALQYDRENAFYYLLKASQENLFGWPKAAEQTLCDMLTNCWFPGQEFVDTTIRRVIKNAYGGYSRTNVLPLRAYLDYLRTMDAPEYSSTLLVGQFAQNAYEGGDGFGDMPNKAKLATTR